MKKFYSRFMLIVLITVMLFFCFLTIEARAANTPYSLLEKISQQEVRGVVSDQAGIPLPGVTVAVKGKNRGTTTNINGEYSIAIEQGDILIFSFVGFQTLEEPVNGRREIMIRLEEDISSLGEVQINAGYYNTTRRESTGNISRVTAEEIELQPVVSPLQALQGRMAGVEILPGGNQPGMASTIRIRGRNSLRDEGNFPLYIIDGVPINSTPLESNSILGNPGPGIDPLNTLNLSNIESIEVLKDADATAIYGSRGANGVVLITTKKGEKGTGLQIHLYKGAATLPNRIEMLNTQQYLQIRRKAFENDLVEPNQYNAYDLVLWDQNRNTDWQDFFFGGSAAITHVNATASGGNENTTYRIGSSYHKQGTIYPGNFEYSKITGNINLNHISNDKRSSFDLNVIYGVDNNSLTGNVDLSHYAFRLPPNAPRIINDDNSLHWDGWNEAGQNNPLAGFHNNSKTNSNNLISNLGISYVLFESLKLKANLGYTYLNGNEILKRPKRSYNPLNWPNIDHSSSHLQFQRKSWIIEPQIVYDKPLGKGMLNALIGATIQENESYSMGLQGDGYVTESLIGNLSAAQNIVQHTSQSFQYRYMAMFARLGYNWQKKYLINLTGRRDGSSRFGPNNRLANFGAIGAAWIFSNENFVERSLPFLSFGKLRGSYGTTGNDQIGDYGFLDAYEATPGPGGLYPTQLANPNYSWEVNKKLEVATEIGILNDRINLGISWYRNRSSNQLVGYPLPAITGFTTVQANLPATVKNSGWEVELYSTVLQSKELLWRTSFNVSFPRNELIEFPGLDQSSYANNYRVGHPLNISFLYEYEGVNPETGFYQIKDINNDGSLDFEDRNVIRSWDRDFYGGLSNNFNYKNFSIQFLIEFVKQEGTFNLFNAGDYGNQSVKVLEALNPDSTLQQISASTPALIAYSNSLNTTLPIQDASFLRIKTLNLGYKIPDSFLKITGLTGGRIFLSGHNLLTCTKYEGIDPEMPIGGTQFAGLRTITAGISSNF